MVNKKLIKFDIKQKEEDRFLSLILNNPMYIRKIRLMRMNDWNTKRSKGKSPNPII